MKSPYFKGWILSLDLQKGIQTKVTVKDTSAHLLTDSTKRHDMELVSITELLP